MVSPNAVRFHQLKKFMQLRTLFLVLLLIGVPYSYLQQGGSILAGAPPVGTNGLILLVAAMLLIVPEMAFVKFRHRQWTKEKIRKSFSQGQEVNE